MTKDEALTWAIRQLHALVHVSGDGAAYIRGTGTELAGFAQKIRECELAASQPGEPPSQKVIEEYQRTWRENNNKGPFGYLSSDTVNDLLADFVAQFFGPSAPSPLPCEGCKTQSLDAFDHDRCFIDKVVCQEQSRWQKALYELSRNHAISPDEIDGSGCDSGDPLDVTVTEVSQVICQLENPQDYRVAPSGSAGQEPRAIDVLEKYFKVGCKCDGGLAICDLCTEAATVLQYTGRLEGAPIPPEGRAESAAEPRWTGVNDGSSQYEFPRTAEPAVVSASPEQILCGNCSTSQFVASHDKELGVVLKCVYCSEQKLIELAAAQPVAANPAKCKWPFKGDCTQQEACVKANRCLRNLPFVPSSESDTLANPPKVPTAQELWEQIEVDEDAGEVVILEKALAILRPFFTQVSQPPTEIGRLYCDLQSAISHLLGLIEDKGLEGWQIGFARQVVRNVETQYFGYPLTEALVTQIR